jgi:hypothetical protein
MGTVDGIEVRELELSEYKEWDLLVEEVQPGTLFHTSQWLEICRDILLIDLRIYGIFRKDNLIGGCPIFVKNLKGQRNLDRTEGYGEKYQNLAYRR